MEKSQPNTVYGELKPGVLKFGLKMALRKALKLIRGLRKQINDLDENVMVRKILEDLEISGWKKEAGKRRLHLRSAAGAGVVDLFEPQRSRSICPVPGPQATRKGAAKSAGRGRGD